MSLFFNQRKIASALLFCAALIPARGQGLSDSAQRYVDQSNSLAEKQADRLIHQELFNFLSQSVPASFQGKQKSENLFSKLEGNIQTKIAILERMDDEPPEDMIQLQAELVTEMADLYHKAVADIFYERSRAERDAIATIVEYGEVRRNYDERAAYLSELCRTGVGVDPYLEPFPATSTQAPNLTMRHTFGGNQSPSTVEVGSSAGEAAAWTAALALNTAISAKLITGHFIWTQAGILQSGSALSISAAGFGITAAVALIVYTHMHLENQKQSETQVRDSKEAFLQRATAETVRSIFIKKCQAIQTKFTDIKQKFSEIEGGNTATTAEVASLRANTEATIMAYSAAADALNKRRQELLAGRTYESLSDAEKKEFMERLRMSQEAKRLNELDAQLTADRLAELIRSATLVSFLETKNNAVVAREAISNFYKNVDVESVRKRADQLRNIAQYLNEKAIARRFQTVQRSEGFAEARAILNEIERVIVERAKAIFSIQGKEELEQRFLSLDEKMREIYKKCRALDVRHPDIDIFRKVLWEFRRYG